MDIGKKIQNTVEKGVSASKKYLNIAKDKAKDFGETSVKKIELHQLEESAKKKKLLLGEQVYMLFTEEKRQSISMKTPELKEIIQELNELQEEIRKKEKESKTSTQK